MRRFLQKTAPGSNEYRRQTEELKKELDQPLFADRKNPVVRENNREIARRPVRDTEKGSASRLPGC